MLPTTVNAPKDSTGQNVRPAQIQENGTSAQINAYVQLQRLSGTDTNVFVIKICLEINAFLAQLQELGTPQRTNVFAHLQRLFSQAVIVNAQLAFTETTVFHALPQDWDVNTKQCVCQNPLVWDGASCSCPQPYFMYQGNCVKCPDGYNWVDNRCKECHCTFVDLQVLGQNNTGVTSTTSGGIQYRCK